MTLGILSGLTLAAQQAGPAVNVALDTAAAVPVQSTANAPEATDAQLRPVTGELVTRIDAKKARTGEPIVVKTTEKATTADGIVIPKGSKIVGHITEVQQHSKENPNSRVTLQFDKAQLKNGQTLPIKSVIESVAPAAGAAGSDVNPFGVGAPGATASAPVAGSPGGAGPGMAPAPTTQTQGSTVALMNNGSAGNSPKPGTVVATQGNVTIKTTAIPGVLIAANADGQPFSNASGALLGARQNVQLDGGTRMTLAICDIPANSTH